MEKDSKASPDSPFLVKVESGKEEALTNGVLHPEKKEGETALEGEFIKVEKDSLDLKDSVHTTEVAIREQENKSSVMERSSRISVESRELLEAQETTKELESEIERLDAVLKSSESENAGLKGEMLVIEEKLKESGKHCEELELDQKKMQEQLIVAEKYSQQVSTLQEALQAQEAKSKELIDVKEAFDGLTVEIESSRKKLQELEKELQSSAVDARKFEELSEQNSSNAVAEAQRALELERLLELAKLSAKDMEDRMASLQEELKGLYEKIAENDRVEEAHRSTEAELSKVQGELELSKSHILDLQRRLTSEESVKNGLTEEVDLLKASEGQVKKDILALENLFSLTKFDLVAKVSELDEIKLKLQEEVEIRKVVEARSKHQEDQVSTVQGEMAKAAAEKVALEAVVEDLNFSIMQMKELCGDLETKLKVSDENFCKADSLLSQALVNNAELEQKLKSLEELHQESGSVAATVTQKNLELEGIVGTTNAAAEQMKSQLRDMETKLISAEQKNLELEQLLNLVEQKCNVAEREVKEFSERVSELDDTLRRIQEEKTLLHNQTHEYKEKVTELEAALSESSLRNLELEEELKTVASKSGEHEGRASASHERSLQLEDLIQISNSKVEDAGTKIGELEMLMEAANKRIRELEEHISTLEVQFSNKEEECKMFSGKASELEGQLEIFQGKVTSLEVALQAANEKEVELKECMNTITEEKTKFEKSSTDSTGKLSEAESMLESLKYDLKSKEEKLKSLEQELKDSGIRESEIMETLNSAEEKLKQHEMLVEQTNARNSELESLHESLARDSDLKLQEQIMSFTKKDAEAKSLYEKLEILEDQRKSCEEKAAEAADRSASLQATLNESLMKTATLESTTIELKSKISAAESGQSVLAVTILGLENKVYELQELLHSASAEKEATFEQLALHMNTISELTDQHSRISVLHSEAESRIKEAEWQLQDALEKYSHRDLDAKDLNEKLNALESQLRIHEDTANEASLVADARKAELEEALFKVNRLETVVKELQSKSAQSETQCEGLAETNMKLTQELVAYESKLNEIQNTLSATLIEKDLNLEQLQSSKKIIEDLTQQLAADGQKLQLQITSVVDENNMLKETYQDSRKEFEATINELKGQLDEQKTARDNLKAEVDRFKSELAEKSVLQARALELEQQLLLADSRFNDEVEHIKVVAAQKEAGLVSKLEEYANKVKDIDVLNEKVLQLQKDLSLAHTTISEQKEADSRRKIEGEAALTNSLQELEAKHQKLILLEKNVEELEKNLLISDAKSTEKDEEVKKLSLVCKEVDDLKKRSSQITELEKTIKELEDKLKLAVLDSRDQVDVGGEVEVKEGIEVKSRDLGSMVSTPSKRKSKKRAATSAQTSSTSEVHVPDTQVSSAINFKFIVVIALVSVILGIILGKRY